MSESYRIQYWQFVNLIALLILAKVTDRLYLGIFDIFILVIFATFLEILFLYFFKKRVFFPISALISGIGVVLMLGAYSFYIYFWAIFFAISQKYLLKINNNHIFNPSNFGVIVSIALFYPKASILVGQIYGYRVIIFFITIMALTILIKVNRWLVSFSFFIFYIIFQYLFISFSDPIWSIDDIINHFMEISFLVFIFFMLSDIRTTPNSYKEQFLFGFCVAFFSVFFEYLFSYRVVDNFLALFLTSFIFGIYGKKLTKKDKYKAIMALVLVILVAGSILLRDPIYFSM